MSEKVKVSRDCSQLKNRTYYIAKVRFFEGNWEHKAFFITIGTDLVNYGVTHMSKGMILTFLLFIKLKY